VHQPPINNDPNDRRSLDGISIELSHGGIWIEIRRENGSWDAAYLSGDWLRTLTGATVAARREAYELMRQSADGRIW
jgi:hypothetical protein